MKISIGNIPQSLTEDQLKDLLSPFGSTSHLTIKRDKITKVSLGFGSVEMDDTSAEKAIASLNGKEIDGKKIVLVNQEVLAKEQQSAGNQKNAPLNQKSPFGKSQGPSGGNTGVMRRGGQRGS
ncbi:RNA binding protein [Leptospira ryugenii]|uniref:RNA binding protein n=1 Tax=Leptospira ryugenii TaxID=1917863 RepID=A0A2P2DXB2_9LEPT|nr:RNA-binding protein [Leptospira ryugenii]GBF49277.1 RNA binding protein [Leptospira ryugenii]